MFRLHARLLEERRDVPPEPLEGDRGVRRLSAVQRVVDPDPEHDGVRLASRRFDIEASEDVPARVPRDAKVINLNVLVVFLAPIPEKGHPPSPLGVMSTPDDTVAKYSYYHTLMIPHPTEKTGVRGRYLRNDYLLVLGKIS